MIRTGLESLFLHRKHLLSNKRIALVANPSSVDSNYHFLVDLFVAEQKWQVVALFGPEHGLRGEMQDQELCDSFRDRATGLPVYSLYGQHLKPTPEMLRGVDSVVFDIQDVGSRYYTFIYTLSYLMEACKESNVEVIVLDRPNPINGVDLEGPVLEAGYESFVGRYPIPIRHGMTVGELALFFHQEFYVNCRLEVISMEGWRRESYFEETALPWILPSPNMPTVDTAIVYPGMCLLEGTNVSEGRGTTRPFEIFGAPWIEPDSLCRRMEDFHLPGVRFRPLFFQPTFNKYRGQLCGGAQMHITDRRSFLPVKTTLCLLFVFLSDYPQSFRWKDPPYEFVTDRLPIDILWGNSWVRDRLEKGEHPDRIEPDWKDGLDRFRELRRKYLLYDA
jgi:uncharacterized protein YbbC (DUF1343 family)